jgi:hypothetical protein
MRARSYLILSFSLWTMACMALYRPDAGIPTHTLLTPTVGATSTLAATLTPVEPASTATRVSLAGFELVGHSPLLNRGMNAALAVHGNYAYVGSRTDGSHVDAGVLVVDISNPASPQVVYQIGLPEEGLAGQTSRELRVWPEQELLFVLNLNCEVWLHACAQTVVQADLSVYDISGPNAATPRRLVAYPLPRVPHEMFLWDDPATNGRALLYISTPGGYIYNLLVLDISGARAGQLQEVGNWGAPTELVTAGLHSLSLSVDGKRAYLAHLRDGFMILDTSELAAGIANPQLYLLTPPYNWAQSSPGPHSAVKLFGKPYVLTTEEVYWACPWAWARILDISDETRPQFVAEYKIHPYNIAEHCADPDLDQYINNSFSAHNPTLTKNLAFITWHSGGLQAISIENPLVPAQVAEFLPAPLPAVGTEDPGLSSGPNKVVMWSYPIIKDGLIYVVDVRNGFYILRYHGPFEAEVAAIRFLEGNSNLGDAQLWAIP